MKTAEATMVHQRIIALGLCLTSVVLAANTQEKWREIRLYVKDSSGQGIADAHVSFDGIREERTDREGMARLEWSPAIRFPLLVQVQARGFSRRLHIVESPDSYTAVIHLVPLSSQLPTGSQTVSATELAPASRQLASQLHRQALDALSRSDYKTAERLLFQALDLAPNSVTIHNNLGVVYLRQADYERASRHFTRAVDMAPEDPNSLGRLGLVRWLQGDFDQSFLLLDKAIGRGFDNPAAHYFFGILALQRGLCKQAAKHFSRLDERRFRHRDLFLAIALTRIGKREAASKAFQRFRVANPAPFVTANRPH
jgi:Tfp pilus assembly protein PilF